MRNLVNEKVYIGQTWTSLKLRWNAGSGYRHSKHVYNAIKKYGKDKFYYEFLTIAHTQEIADYWENYFIDEYDATNREMGYNIKRAGSRGKHSKETKMEISKKGKGRVTSNKTKKLLSIALTGITRSEETKKKISLANKGRTWKVIDGKRVWMDK